MLTSDIDKFFSLQQKRVHIFKFEKVAPAASTFNGCSHSECNLGHTNFENLSLKMGNGDVIRKFNIYTEF